MFVMGPPENDSLPKDEVAVGNARLLGEGPNAVIVNTEMLKMVSATFS